MLQAESPKHTAPKELAQTNQVLAAAPRPKSDILPGKSGRTAEILLQEGSVMVRMELVAPNERPWNQAFIRLPVAA